MNDLDALLTAHLRDQAASIRPVERLDAVHAAAGRSHAARWGTSRRTWVGVAAGVVAVAGVGAAVVSRRSGSTPATSTVPPGALPVTPGPTVADHWHEAYGFWLCGEWRTLAGSLESPLGEVFAATGIHSHDDGVIHIHPAGPAGSGANATLGTFLDAYDVGLTDDSLVLPPSQGGVTVPLSCAGEASVLSVTVWPDAADEGGAVTVTEGLAAVPLLDGAAITIAVAPPGSRIPMPPAAADLGQLDDVDGGGAATP